MHQPTPTRTIGYRPGHYPRILRQMSGAPAGGRVLPAFYTEHAHPLCVNNSMGGPLPPPGSPVTFPHRIVGRSGEREPGMVGPIE